MDTIKPDKYSDDSSLDRLTPIKDGTAGDSTHRTESISQNLNSATPTASVDAIKPGVAEVPIAHLDQILPGDSLPTSHQTESIHEGTSIGSEHSTEMILPGISQEGLGQMEMIKEGEQYSTPHQTESIHEGSQGSTEHLTESILEGTLSSTDHLTESIHEGSQVDAEHPTEKILEGTLSPTEHQTEVILDGRVDKGVHEDELIHDGESSPTTHETEVIHEGTSDDGVHVTEFIHEGSVEDATHITESIKNGTSLPTNHVTDTIAQGSVESDGTHATEVIKKDQAEQDSPIDKLLPIADGVTTSDGIHETEVIHEGTSNLTDHSTELILEGTLSDATHATEMILEGSSGDTTHATELISKGVVQDSEHTTEVIKDGILGDADHETELIHEGSSINPDHITEVIHEGTSVDPNHETEVIKTGESGDTTHITESIIEGSQGPSDHETELILDGTQGDTEHTTESILEGTQGESEHETESILDGTSSDTIHETEEIHEGEVGESDHTTESIKDGTTGESDHETEVIASGESGDTTHETEVIMEGTQGDTDHTTEFIIKGEVGDSTHETEVIAEGTQGDSEHSTEIIAEGTSGPTEHVTEMIQVGSKSEDTHTTDRIKPDLNESDAPIEVFNPIAGTQNGQVAVEYDTADEDFRTRVSKGIAAATQIPFVGSVTSLIGNTLNDLASDVKSLIFDKRYQVYLACQLAGTLLRDKVYGMGFPTNPTQMVAYLAKLKMSVGLGGSMVSAGVGMLAGLFKWNKSGGSIDAPAGMQEANMDRVGGAMARPSTHIGLDDLKGKLDEHYEKLQKDKDRRVSPKYKDIALGAANRTDPGYYPTDQLADRSIPSYKDAQMFYDEFAKIVYGNSSVKPSLTDHQNQGKSIKDHQASKIENLDLKYWAPGGNWVATSPFKGRKSLAGFSLDSTHLWDVCLKPYVGPENGNTTFLPTPGKKPYAYDPVTFDPLCYWDAEAEVGGPSSIKGSCWLPAISYSMEYRGMESKDFEMSLGNDPLRVAISEKLPSRFTMTLVDDQYGTWSKYFYVVSKRMTATKGLLVAPYKNLTYQLNLFILDPAARIRWHRILLVTLDPEYSTEFAGEEDASVVTLQINFQVVGEIEQEEDPEVIL